MKTIWFKRTHWLYIPVHPMGALVSIAAFAAAAHLFMGVMERGNALSDDLREIFIYGSSIAFWWKWVADKTSES